MSTAREAGLSRTWRVERLGDVVDILDSRRVPVNSEARAQRPGSVPYYGATGQVGWIDDNLFEEELVLLGEDGAPFLDRAKPKAYLIRGRSWVNNHAHVLRARPGLLNSFLLHQLNTIDYRLLVSGTTRLKLPQAPMREIRLVVPPEDIQREIVEEIEEQLTRLDAGVAALKAVQANLKRYRAAVLKAACEGRLVPTEADLARREGRSYEPASVLLDRIKAEKATVAAALRRSTRRRGGAATLPADRPPLPEGWACATIGEFATVTTGRTPPTADQSYFGGTVPFVKPTDLDAAYYVNGARECLTVRGAEYAGVLEPPSVLVTCIGATIGKVGLARVQCAANQQINAVTVDPGRLSPEYLYFAICGPSTQVWIRENAVATTLPILKKSRFGQLPILIPPFAEQQRIVAEVERRLSLADELDRVLSASLNRASHLRQSILATAFTGSV